MVPLTYESDIQSGNDRGLVQRLFPDADPMAKYQAAEDAARAEDRGY